MPVCPTLILQVPQCSIVSEWLAFAMNERWECDEPILSVNGAMLHRQATHVD
jgi:hypothetical protein